jgi:nucleoside-diphosphate-sugar epimerase
MTSLKLRKVLITGGAGFIGYHLSKLHAESGDRVTIADNFALSKADNDLAELLKAPNARLVQADLSRPEEWNKLGSGYDFVYHLAALNATKKFYDNPDEVLRAGSLPLFYLFDWMRGTNKNDHTKVMFASSNEAYAGALEAFEQLPIPTPESVPLVISDISNPRWSYAVTKIVGEALFLSMARRYGTRIAIVRPHNFYGPRSGHHVIPELIERILQRTDPFPVYGASDTRAFCYVEDAVKAMKLVMDSDATDGQTYNIGGSEETVIRDLVERLFVVSGWRPKQLDVAPPPTGSVKRRLPDVSKIKRDVGWQAETTLEDGLRKTFAWHNKKFSVV